MAALGINFSKNLVVLTVPLLLFIACSQSDEAGDSNTRTRSNQTAKSDLQQPIISYASGTAGTTPPPVITCGSSTASPELGAPASLTITSPHLNQVIQRDPKNGVDLIITGNLSNAATCIEAKVDLVDASSTGGISTVVPWSKVDTSSGSLTANSFSGTLRVRAGGWYRLSVRPWVDQVAGPFVTIEKFGIGEVFIAAGQSNSTNCGYVKQTVSDPRIVAFNGTNWVPGNDPQPLAIGTPCPKVSGGSPWPPMANALAAKLDLPIGLLSVGWGNTVVANWQPGGSYYPRITNALKMAGSYGVRAILWHQGESDTANKVSANQYASLLSTVISQSRKDAGYNVWWVVAGASYMGDANRAYQAAIREGQQAVVDGKSTFAGPTTDDLLGSMRAPDGIHMSDAGLKEHGLRWANELLKIIK